MLGLAIACLSGGDGVATDGQDALESRNSAVGKILFLGNSITLHGPAPGDRLDRQLGDGRKFS